MADEIKPTQENQEPKPTETPASAPDAQAKPNQEPARSPDHAQKISELEKQLKERDSKIADLSTTVATIEERHRQTQRAEATVDDDKDLDERLNKVAESMITDPKTAAQELKSIIKSVKTGAVSQARHVINTETVLEKLKLGVKSANPEFDDDVVEVIMQRANEYAGTGKFKTAQEAVEEATKFVKTKFESYASRRNSVPPLPSGAHAEGGGSNQPPKPQEPPKVLSPLEELEQLNEAKGKKLYL